MVGEQQTLRRRPSAARAAGWLLLLLLTSCVDTSCLRTECRSPTRWLAFNPLNNQEVLVTWCFKDAPCTLAIVNLDTGHVRLLPNIPIGYGGEPAFAPDGRHIVFPVSLGEGLGRQLAIMDLDGSGYRLLTSGPYTNGAPHFSPDGTTLAFVRAENETGEPGKKRFLHWDIYELQLSDGAIRRRTANGFMSANALSYLNPQGDLLVSLFPPPKWLYPPVDDNPPGVRMFPPDVPRVDFPDWEQYLAKYKDNHIHLIDARGIHPEPYVVQGDNTPDARVANNLTTVVVKSVAEKGRGHDLFLWQAGDLKRVTTFASRLTGYAVSADGKHLAVFVDDDGNGQSKLWVQNTDGSSARMVAEDAKPENYDEWARTDPRFATR